LGFICSIGFYPLFYTLNRPNERWRRVLLLIAVIFSHPLYLLWHGYFHELSQFEKRVIDAVDIITGLILLSFFVLLGKNRLRTAVSVLFVFGTVNMAQIPVIYFLTAIVNPLVNLSGIVEILIQYPYLFHYGYFFTNILITGCCFLAVRWLKKTPEKPPFKYCAFFGLIFIAFNFIVILWQADLFTLISKSFLAFSSLGLFLLALLLLVMYLFTRFAKDAEHLLAGGSKVANEQFSSNDVSDEYARFIQQLSKRELEVVDAILGGNLSQKELADTLKISVNTVKTHLKNIYQIAGVPNITALVAILRRYSTKSP
jgi:DNA-binding CsgD family transcriptional regulator